MKLEIKNKKKEKPKIKSESSKKKVLKMLEKMGWKGKGKIIFLIYILSPFKILF
jgi:hypothetical protein